MSDLSEGEKPRGGRPRKAVCEARSRRIVVWVNAREQARYLVNAARAGLTGADYARALLCSEPGSRAPGNDNLPGPTDAGSLGPSPSSFELVDALSRIGVALHHVAPVILATGHVPGEFDALLHRLDALLDQVLPE